MTNLKIPEKIRNLDNMFWKNRRLFKKKVKNINKIFELKKNNDLFKDDHPPTFFSGNIHSKKIKYIFIGLNPGYNEEHNKKEYNWRKNSKEKSKKQMEDCINLFEYFYENKWPGYYTRILNIVKDFSKKEKKKERYEYCKKYLINIDAFPFHSKSFKIKIDNLTPQQYIEFFKYWNSSKELIKMIKSKYIIIFGKANLKLFMMDPSIDKTKLKLIKKFKKERGGFVHIYKIIFADKKTILVDTFLGGGKNMSLNKKNIKEISNYIRSILK
ncbi:MAG: hypothetical protein ABIH25_00430 [Candidatus Woesearchaeota archaeon]